MSQGRGVRTIGIPDLTSKLGKANRNVFTQLTSESNPAIDSLLLFTGRPFDTDTQLQNNLNRWYDFRVGRWLSEDPVGFSLHSPLLFQFRHPQDRSGVSSFLDRGLIGYQGDVNLYVYVVNSPISKLDFTGKNWWDWIPGVGTGVNLIVPTFLSQPSDYAPNLSWKKCHCGNREMAEAQCKYDIWVQAIRNVEAYAPGFIPATGIDLVSAFALFKAGVRLNVIFALDAAINTGTTAWRITQIFDAADAAAKARCSCSARGW